MKSYKCNSKYSLGLFLYFLNIRLFYLGAGRGITLLWFPSQNGQGFNSNQNGELTPVWNLSAWSVQTRPLLVPSCPVQNSCGEQWMSNNTALTEPAMLRKDALPEFPSSRKYYNQFSCSVNITCYSRQNKFQGTTSVNFSVSSTTLCIKFCPHSKAWRLVYMPPLTCGTGSGVGGTGTTIEHGKVD